MPATFLVNTTADSVDANPGDGFAQDADGQTSLRAAIIEANALAGADRIDAPAGTYTLTIAGVGENAAATGDLDITGDLSVIGVGAGTKTVNAAGLDRVFHVQSATVTLEGLTIAGGEETLGESGGGVWNRGGALTARGCTITDNAARVGGGIATDPGGGTDILSSGPDALGTFTSAGNNLIGDDTDAAGFTQPTDVVNVDPLLGPLADNGGPTWTHALLAGSPAIDAGSTDPLVTTDQRGVARPQGPAPDIGAFEFVPTVGVQIDIRSESPNEPINIGSSGMLPVTLYGAPGVHVRDVDIATVRFAAAGVSQWNFADVNGDGYEDLVLSFRIPQTNLRQIYADLLVEADQVIDGRLDDSVSNRQPATLTLSGSTFGGQQLAGEDTAVLFLAGRQLRDLVSELVAANLI